MGERVCHPFCVCVIFLYQQQKSGIYSSYCYNNNNKLLPLCLHLACYQIPARLSPASLVFTRNHHRCSDLIIIRRRRRMSISKMGATKSAMSYLQQSLAHARQYKKRRFSCTTKSRIPGMKSRVLLGMKCRAVAAASIQIIKLRLIEIGLQW